MSEDMLTIYMKTLSKKKSLNQKELKSFMKIYNFLKKIYDREFKTIINGKRFGLEFDYSPKK